MNNPPAQSDQPKPDLTERILERVHPEVRATFSQAQVEALRKALGNRIDKKHAVDLRLSVPLPGRSIYCVLLAGAEGRSHDRLKQEANVLLVPATLLASILLGIGAIAGLVQLKQSQLFAAPDPAAEEDTFHPTQIPFKTNQADCEASGRQWEDEKCLDYEHNPDF